MKCLRGASGGMTVDDEGGLLQSGPRSDHSAVQKIALKALCAKMSSDGLLPLRLVPPSKQRGSDTNLTDRAISSRPGTQTTRRAAAAQRGGGRLVMCELHRPGGQAGQLC
jgi:hypothetical protein